ncbi:MAG: hypothetical protein M0Z94_13350 [Dehalococcoidales bacterium]|nr:hypothetical protein [Dehalococcoidales bacterium]
MNTAIMALITGALLPLVTGYLTRAKWAEWLKFIVVIIVAAVVGAVELQLAGKLEGITWATAYSYLGAVYVASAAMFWLLIDQTGLRAWLEAHGVK